MAQIHPSAATLVFVLIMLSNGVAALLKSSSCNLPLEALAQLKKPPSEYKIFFADESPLFMFSQKTSVPF